MTEIQLAMMSEPDRQNTTPPDAGRPHQLRRVGVLAVVLGTMALLTVRAIVRPQSAKAPGITFDLPEAIALEGWQLQASQPWSRATGRPAPSESAREYRYLGSDGENLRIRTLFIGRAGDGNTSRLLQVYTAAQPASVRIEIVDREGIGSYGFFTFAGEASILACITGSGNTTVTSQQFSQSVSLEMGRILPWLLGQQDLFDRSCLFGIVSVPARPQDLSLDRYPELEMAWLAWAAHWQQSNRP